MRRTIGSLLLIGSLVGSAGCFVSARARIYDEPHGDYHRWDAREDRAYRQYLAEQRREYRAFKTLDRREQDEYWQWRHGHPDRD